MSFPSLNRGFDSPRPQGILKLLYNNYLRFKSSPVFSRNYNIITTSNDGPYGHYSFDLMT